MKNITIEDLKTMISEGDTVIIDCRTEEEWKTGIIADALTIDVMNEPQYQVEAAALDGEKRYAVICRSGRRSILGCNILTQLGMDAYNVVGGMMAWEGEVVQP